MENSKADSNPSSADQVENSGSAVTNVDNNNTIINNDEARAVGDADGGSRRRTAFTDLSQEEADLALARTIQDQERAYMMLRRNAFGNAGDLMFRRNAVADSSDSSSWETVSDVEDHDFDGDHADEDEGNEGGEDDNNEAEDAFDANSHDEENADSQNVDVVDPSAYSSDEAFARALQLAEEREMAARMMAMAGIHDMVVDGDGYGNQDEDDDDSEEDGVDPDELSYEELIALGEFVGTESRGLSTDTINSLPWVKYKAESAQNGSCDESCVICRLEYDEGEKLTVLPCKHLYHSECILKWLEMNKVCPVCNAEVSTSGSS